MKDKILKIAGVKTEKQFYAKYPSEEAFMKVHGKAFKKAQIGAVISGGVQTATPKPIDFNSLYDQADMTATGQTNKMRQDEAYKQANLAAQQKQANNSGGGGDGLAGIVGQIGKMAGAKKGAKLSKAFGGNTINPLTGLVNDPSTMQGLKSPSLQSVPGMPSSLGYNLSGNASGQQFDLSGNAIQGQSAQQQVSGMPGATGASGKGGGSSALMSTIKKAAGPAGDIIGGIQELNAEKKQLAQSKQQLAVSDLSRQVSELKPEQTQRKYARPEDIQNTGEEFFPIYGVGTNVLARNGAMLQDGGPIGGNPTEIQNTYGTGNSIYDDLGYEPLSDSEIVKQYRAGGLVQAQNGFTNFMGAGGTDMATQAAGSLSGNNAGSQIGKGIGNSLKMIPGVGSVVGAVAAPVLSAIGGALDTTAHGIQKNQAATQRNITTSALNQGVKGIQAQNTSFMEDGGWMNPEYNPQVIAKFGDHSAQDIYDYAHEGMQSLRAGGHLRSYTAPSEEAMQTYAMGGELQTHWGGGAETISQNPYLPDGGETVMFRGNSHEERSPNGETGIGVTYGNNPVEVERGEPAVKLQDGTGGDSSLVVYGNLQIPKYGVDMLGDPKAKGKKFKNYVADLSKSEAKYNKILDRSSDNLDELDVRTPIDQLQLSALQANLMGGNMHLENIAKKKKDAAHIQQAINDTAQENGLVADDLARGKITIDKEAQKQYARFGGKFESAQNGYNEPASWNIPARVSNWAEEQLGNLYDEYVPQGTKDIIEPTLQHINDFNINPFTAFDPEAATRSREYAEAHPVISGIAPTPSIRAGALASRAGKGAARAGDKAFEEAYAVGKKTSNAAKKVKGSSVDNYVQPTGSGTIKTLTPAQEKLKKTEFWKTAGAYGAGIGASALAAKAISHYTTPTLESTDAAHFKASQQKRDGDMIDYYKAANGFKEPVGLTVDELKNLGLTSTSSNQLQSSSLAGNVDRTNYNYLVGLYDEAKKQQRGPAVEKFQREFSRIDPEKARSVLSQSPVTNYGKSQGMTTPSLESNYDQIFGPRTEAYRNSLEAPAADQLMQPRGELLPINAKPLPNQLMPMMSYAPMPKKNNDWWMNYADQALQYLRPNPRVEQPDLTPEMMAMSMNQLEPVKAQGYQPDLRVPYDISFQDRLNANQGDYRATQKLLGGNPEALAALNAQKYGANSQVLADQFRANQAMKDQVYSGNTQTLNDAKLKNLGIYDQQYTRQEEGKSKTKQQALEVVKSISDKIAKQKQEQRMSDLKSQEHNYRFDSKGRPIYMGPLARFNTSGGAGPNRGLQDIPEDWLKLYDETGAFQGTKKKPKKKEDDETTRNGGKIKSRNGSIVNAIKNL